ncbi:MAG TPA: hypothetical protein VF178_05350 [Gemmatimonadaceae bacterium]
MLRDVLSRGTRAGATSISAWIRDADEAVLVALVRREAPGALAAHSMPLIQRALDEATAENLFWTPLLDALASEGHWPVPTWSVGSPAVKPDERYTGPKEMLSRLAAWMETVDEPDALDGLLLFTHQELRTLLARHARVFSPGLLAELVPVYASTLANNPHAAPYRNVIATRLLATAPGRVGSGTA